MSRRLEARSRWRSSNRANLSSHETLSPIYFLALASLAFGHAGRTRSGALGVWRSGSHDDFITLRIVKIEVEIHSHLDRLTVTHCGSHVPLGQVLSRGPGVAVMPVGGYGILQRRHEANIRHAPACAYQPGPLLVFRRAIPKIGERWFGENSWVGAGRRGGGWERLAV